MALHPAREEKKEKAPCAVRTYRAVPVYKVIGQRNKSCITLFWYAFPLDERHL